LLVGRSGTLARHARVRLVREIVGISSRFRVGNCDLRKRRRDCCATLGRVIDVVRGRDNVSTPGTPAEGEVEFGKVDGPTRLCLWLLMFLFRKVMRGLPVSTAEKFAVGGA